MKKLILVTLTLIVFLSPSPASVNNNVVTAQEMKVPKKVQNAYDAEVDRITVFLFFQYGGLVVASGEIVSRTGGGNYNITFDLFDMVDVLPHQVLNMIIKPNGELVQGCVISLP